MKRYLSPRLYYQTRELSDTVIELDDSGRFSRLISMRDCQVEPAGTLYVPEPLVWDGERLTTLGPARSE